MLIIDVLVVLMILAILSESFGVCNYDLNATVFILCAICLFIVLITLPLSHYEVKEFIAKYEVTQETLNVTRAVGGDDLERIAIQHKVIEINQTLAGYKYWNSTIFDIWIPDEIEELELIK